MAAWIHTKPLLGVHWHLGMWNDECLTLMKASVTEVSIDLSEAKDSDQWPHSKKSSPRRHAQ